MTFKINKNGAAPKLLLGLFLLGIISGLLALIAPKANAALFTKAYIRLDRMSDATPTTGLVCAEPGTSSSDVKTWEVTFPAGFTVSSTASNWQTSNISISDLPAGTSAWPNATSATATIGSQTVTWTNSSPETMNTGTTYCYRWTASAALTTSTAGADKTGSITTKNSSAVTIDTVNYATAVIADDQIVVSATVPANFTFTLEGNSDSLGTLSRTAISSSAGKYVEIFTNANSGWIAWVKSNNAALSSASRSASIATTGTVNGSPDNLSIGTEGYVLDVDLTTEGPGGGTVTIAGEYNGGASGGGTLSTTFQPIASSNGGADGDKITLVEKAAISGLTKEATDYTDTLTVVGAGQF